MSIPMVITSILVVITVFVVGRLSVTQSSKYQSDQRSLQYYNEQYQSMVGSTLLIGDGKVAISYNLESFDGGKNWFSVTYGDSDEVVSIEPADPKLVAHVKAMIQLGNHVIKQGPINGTDAEGIEILEAAGFTVEVK